MDLMAFTWSAMASGVVGNAAYDGIKVILGNSFQRLADYVSQQQEAKFKETLEILLESNDALRTQLAALATGKQTHITTGDIKANGNVIIGNHNRMG